MENIFFEITIIICLAAILSIIFKLLKQPLILAYILTGIIIGPFGQLQLVSSSVLQVMGEFGITLLLFILGLEIKLKDFQSIGKTALIAGVLQIFITQVIFYFTAIFLGFSQVSSFYISAALTFSSTVIVVKLLSDKKELLSLFGRISVGILLIQDLFAILLLMFLSSFNPVSVETFNFSPLTVFLVLVKALILFSVIFFLSKKVFPSLLDNLAKSQETLFLISIAWVFGLAALVSSPIIGFSVEIGGFLAGLALANASENFQIAARLKSLRDFFITLFFVFLGMRMIFTDFTKILFPSIILAVLVLVLKPIIVTAITGFMGYRRRTSFFTGISLAQVSEFSLIILFLGNKLGHIQNEVVSLITLVAIITFVFSTYIFLKKNSLYKMFHPYLKLFEKKNAYGENISSDPQDLEDHIILIGADGMGQSILETITPKNKVLVVDFNPDIIKKLKEKNINSLFGDISDFDIQEKLNLTHAKIVVSTIPDLENNLSLIKKMNRSSKKTKIIVGAENFEEAKKLYKMGADYVVMPDVAGGKHVGKILAEDNLDKIETFKNKDLASL